jgi:hypothetical protein
VSRWSAQTPSPTPSWSPSINHQCKTLHPAILRHLMTAARFLYIQSCESEVEPFSKLSVSHLLVYSRNPICKSVKCNNRFNATFLEPCEKVLYFILCAKNRINTTFLKSGELFIIPMFLRKKLS